jgi:hypothetical protein
VAATREGLFRRALLAMSAIGATVLAARLTVLLWGDTSSGQWSP